MVHNQRHLQSTALAMRCTTSCKCHFATLKMIFRINTFINQLQKRQLDNDNKGQSEYFEKLQKVDRQLERSGDLEPQVESKRFKC